jgi:ATP/maltotriose-dependent transcriptional regulator MalT
MVFGTMGASGFGEAVQHAFASKNLEKTASLADQYGLEMFFLEQHRGLRNWLEAVSIG